MPKRRNGDVKRADKGPIYRERTFSADRTLEDTGGVKGEDRKRAVDAKRTGGSERTETEHSLRK